MRYFIATLIVFGLAGCNSMKSTTSRDMASTKDRDESSELSSVSTDPACIPAHQWNRVYGKERLKGFALPEGIRLDIDPGANTPWIVPAQKNQSRTVQVHISDHSMYCSFVKLPFQDKNSQTIEIVRKKTLTNPKIISQKHDVMFDLEFTVIGTVGGNMTNFRCHVRPDTTLVTLFQLLARLPGAKNLCIPQTIKSDLEEGPLQETAI